METFVFKELVTDPHPFFDILPEDWQQEIVPFWEGHKATAKIYVIFEEDEIIGGGIVFTTCPPNFDYFEEEANYWINKGYHYLGFIWIAEHKRNNNLGSFWLSKIKAENPEQNYFLLTEENRLHHFYVKNGFERIKSLKNKGQFEWLYLSKADLK